jgi:hypothetical protein
MIFEVSFWIAFIAVSRMIAKIYDRRRDVLYGPYRATNRGRSRIDGGAAKLARVRSSTKMSS